YGTEVVHQEFDAWQATIKAWESGLRRRQVARVVGEGSSGSNGGETLRPSNNPGIDICLDDSGKEEYPCVIAGGGCPSCIAKEIDQWSAWALTCNQIELPNGQEPGPTDLQYEAREL